MGGGNEPVMRETEQRRVPYLFKLCGTANVKRAIGHAMASWERTMVGKGNRANCGSAAKAASLRCAVATQAGPHAGDQPDH